ncbi:hypothetical protein LX36DRAFT_753552 [Colletotrichum falcatum]|nr:hypothetical protein LX36DRAFT_753552 [Colletotrichum falcatum]
MPFACLHLCLAGYAMPVHSPFAKPDGRFGVTAIAAAKMLNSSSSSSNSLDALRTAPSSATDRSETYSASFEDLWSGISLGCRGGGARPSPPATEDQLATGFFGKLPKEVGR